MYLIVIVFPSGAAVLAGGKFVSLSGEKAPGSELKGAYYPNTGGGVHYITRSLATTDLSREVP